MHRIYEADESFRALDFMVKTRLFLSHIVIQILLGTLVPLLLLAAVQLFRFGERARQPLYADGRRPHAHWHLRDALERRHRRPAVLEELPGIHDLQNGLRDA